MHSSRSGRANGEDRNTDLGRNLRFLCCFYRSTSEVCRRIGINRQQFNKYLTGEARPSRHNMHRICDFFGVEEYELLFPHEELRNLIAVKGFRATERSTDPVGQAVHDAVAATDSDIRRYYGYYYCYYFSFSSPGRILKGLVKLSDRNGVSVYKRIERLVDHERPTRRSFIFKYEGTAFFFRERMFLIDRETLTGNEISGTILSPSYKNRVGVLPGLILGVAGNTSREPVASRVVFEYLGRSIDVRARMRTCGLYGPDDPAIDQPLRDAIRNEVPAGSYDLRAIPQ